MKADYKLIEIKLVDFIPFFGIFTIMDRALEAGECRFYPLNVLRTHLLLYFNGFISIGTIIFCVHKWLYI